MPRGMKTGNEYAEVLGRLYADIPKSVLAAIVVSWAMCPQFEDVPAKVLDEWGVLHDNGIVPQKPPKQEGA